MTAARTDRCNDSINGSDAKCLLATQKYVDAGSRGAVHRIKLYH